MKLTQGMFIVAATVLSAAWADPATQPMLSKIECSGKTSDDRTVQIVIVVDAGTLTYPAPITARLQLGVDSPEALATTLTLGSETDSDGTRTLHVFHSALDLHRGFTARTADLKSGSAILKLENAIQAPQLSCAFTMAGETASQRAARSGNPAYRPISAH